MDEESREWRSIHREKILKELNPFLARVFRKSQSKNSVTSKAVGILNLCSWQRKLPSEVVASIKSGSQDPYALLDDFVGHMSEIGTSPFAIKNSVSSARRFLVFSGVQINSDTFKDRVEMPRVRARTQDEPLTIEKVKKAFVNSPSVVGKRLIAVLVSTGMRINEALPLRYSEIDFSVKPPRIFLPQERTKDRLARYCWLTDEVAALITEAGLSGDQYLFPTSSRGRWKNHGAMSYSNAHYIFQTALKRAGLYKEDKFGRALITLHSARKLTYTRLAAAIGKEYAQAIVGHKEYLDSSYMRLTLEELGQKFLEGQQAITIMAPQPLLTEDQIDQKIIDAIAKHLGAHPKKVDQKVMDAIARRSGVDPDEDASYDLKATDPKEYAGWDFDAENKKLQEEMKAHPERFKPLPLRKHLEATPKGAAATKPLQEPTQKLISIGELGEYLSKNWTLVSVVNGSKAVVQRPKE